MDNRYSYMNETMVNDRGFMRFFLTALRFQDFLVDLANGNIQ